MDCSNCTKLLEMRSELIYERQKNLLILGCIITWVGQLPKELGQAIKEGKDLAGEE